MPAPPTWREIPAAEAESLANTPWWELFDDPQLQELIRIALVENKDLKIAVERIEEARARYGFTKADLWPKVDLTRHRRRPALQRREPDPHARGRRAGRPGRPRPRSTPSPPTCPGRSTSSGRIRRATRGPAGAVPRHPGGAARRRPDPRRGRGPRLPRAARLRPPPRDRAPHDRSRAGSTVQLAKDRFEGGLTPELDLRQAEAELQPRRGDRLRPRAPDRAEGERALGAAGPQPGRRSCAAARVDEQKLPAAVPAGLPVGAARAASRHPRGRADAGRRHREHRRGQGAALPAHRAHRLLRLRQHRVRHALRGPEQVLEHHRQPAAADLQRRQEPAPRRDHRVAAAPDALRLRARDPAGLPRDRGRARGLPQDRRAAAGPGRRAWRPSARCWSWPSCATAAASPPTSRCSTPSARSSTRSWTRPRRIGSHLISLVRLYKALGGGWPESPEATTAAPPPPPPPPAKP